ncbi:MULTISPECIES: DNA alkylation repair protein [unclassified Modestobacter]|uniref:DNA alkylation repair protein n=1 Tax=unclassified Modestobacter TaxID=2643866 RepID=UPI0022AACC28|nr:MULTISPECIES: DNA alkylation repair protein [unclassified Modestobacter]MCZ2826934.1 DNA alkylation repair protein [Modestobacter sp. VKM Ac-2981]MCZ2855370.1 DNA alkylation repair protein [Modestobacter sp. VKM Ac-2982]
MPFAEELIGPQVATMLFHSIHAAAPGRSLRVLPHAAGALDGLSLRERADLLRDALLADVPGDHRALADVIRAARDASPDFGGWLIWPVTSAVASRAVQRGSDEDFTDAMALLAELTGRLTSEFAVRTLLRHDLDLALESVPRWTGSPDDHVRRLASEGTRPYLPWATRVPQLFERPGVTVPILDALYRDGSEYVRRSVANHLNDLSRDEPGLVVDTARRWLGAPAPTTPALVRRGLRTLVKRGHPGALGLLGFAPAAVAVDGPHIIDEGVPWGGSVRFRAALRNVGVASARLAIDYVVHHRKANGASSEKTFKLASRTLAAGEDLQIDRAHSFRQITTRRYHPGAHAIALQVNGVLAGPAPFELLAPTATDPP